MSQPSWSLADFLRELKRRRVYRVAVVYATVAFVILEGCSFIFPALLLPDWTFRLLVVLALVGFPIALTLAWAFEITPEGVRRTEPVAPEVGVGVAKWTKAGALIAVTLVAAVGAYWGFLRPDTAEARPKQLVVVAPFVNQTGDRHLDALGYQATEWITQGLAQTRVAMVVPFENAFIASRTVQTAGIPFSGTEAIAAFAEETAADIVVTGSFYQQGDEILLQARVSDASTGEVRFGLEPISASAGAPRAGLEALSDQVMVALAASVDPDWTLEPVDPDLIGRPQSFEAYQEYLAGMEAHYIDHDWEAAVAHFDSAAALDTTWLLPTLNTCYPYANMGELAKADSVTALVNSQRNRLTQLERLYIDEQIADTKGDLYGRLQIVRRMFEIMPGDITHNGILGVALVQVNHPQEAVTVLNRVRGKHDGWEFPPSPRRYTCWGTTARSSTRFAASAETTPRARPFSWSKHVRWRRWGGSTTYEGSLTKAPTYRHEGSGLRAA